ncbi:MAG: asparagine synthase C-terminal domain-containing protein, partial [Planctomycetes bacterium]|nr:asparagine synthase C-terminal domain-containing protein [Planctomycetota bacterium]
LFPLYYFERDGVVLVGSSATLFRQHPLFSTGVSPEGLAGILATNGLVDGQSLLQNVRRLAPGHLLRWNASGPLRSVPQYVLPATRRFEGESQESADRIAGDTLREVLRKHSPAVGQTSMLLSGGLDSRLVAGMLQRQHVQPAALCLGLATDWEVIAAQRVSDVLRWPLHREHEESGEDGYVGLAQRTARCEALSAGFSSLDMWAAGAELTALGSRFFSGIMLDELLGGYAFQLAYEKETGGWCPERFSRRIRSWGVAPTVLGELLQPLGGHDLVRHALDRFHREYKEGDGMPWQQAFRAKLATRCRFHLGAGVWRLSFGSWPIAPFLDRRLLELAIDLPPGFMMERACERRLLLRDFPDLAEIPLADGTNRFQPLRLGLVHQIGNRIARAVPRFVRTLYRWNGIERRRYHRHFDLNALHWQAIRRNAERYRERLHSWMNPAILARYLPPPTQTIRLRDPFGAGAGLRMILGMMLWSEHGQ